MPRSWNARPRNLESGLRTETPGKVSFVMLHWRYSARAALVLSVACGPHLFPGPQSFYMK
jgi:hypothetical protein